MKITKHGHACLELELAGKKALIDPGFYTEDVSGLKDVVALVITHSHDDHFAGLTTLMRTDHRIRYYATPLVRSCVTKKLMALMSMDQEDFGFFRYCVFTQISVF